MHAFSIFANGPPSGRKERIAVWLMIISYRVSLRAVVELLKKDLDNMSAAIGIVYLNAYILTQWPWAATLTMLQMLFCSIAARGCVFAGLSDPAKVGMTPRHYMTICV